MNYVAQGFSYYFCLPLDFARLGIRRVVRHSLLQWNTFGTDVACRYWLVAGGRGAVLLRSIRFEKAKKYQLFMMRRSPVLSSRDRRLAALFLGAILSMPFRASACAVCFGQSDSDMARGLNMGILALLVVVMGVLGGFAAFFIYLVRKSAGQKPLVQTESALSKNDVADIDLASMAKSEL